MSLCLISPSDKIASRAGAPGRSPGAYVKRCPSNSLAAVVDHYWIARWDRRDTVARDAGALLDPCVHMQIIAGAARVHGVMRGAFRIRIDGAGCVVGVKFRPGGFYPFVRASVSRWTDRTVPADAIFAATTMAVQAWGSDLWNAAASCTGDRVENATLIATQLDGFLEQRLPSRDPIAEEIGLLVDVIASNAAIKRIDDLVRASGRSERTLQRLFARYIGVSPAWVIKWYRLKTAAARLTAVPAADARDVACDLGYADQAHFIRDFRATIGVTPGAYVHSRS